MHAKALSICYVMIFHVIFKVVIEPTLRTKTRLKKKKMKSGTCSSAHAPGGQPVGRGEAVEHANILRCQELHKLGVLEHFSLAVQDGRRLVRDVNNLPGDEGDGHSENILTSTEVKNKCQQLNLGGSNYSQCVICL